MRGASSSRSSRQLSGGVIFQVVCILLCLGPLTSTLAFTQQRDPQFISFEEARAALAKMKSGEAAGLSPNMQPAEWDEWLKKSDAEIRQRLVIGEEDSLTNLLRFGVTFTREYRIDDEYLLRYGNSTLVNSFAENRADDLIKALAAPNENQGFIEMRAFVEKQGFSLSSAAAKKKLKAYLLANLSRMQMDLIEAREHADPNSNQAFQRRGISLDSNLWPDYDLDLSLQRLVGSGLMQSGQVNRIAIVGPGLDFVNKQEGVDYYPPQTTQPFAVLDSLLRLGLARPADVRLYALDISPRVNLHLENARKNAARGISYTVQLPWYAGGRWTPEFRGYFTAYWRGLGAKIGEPVAAIPVPTGSPGFETRAIKIRPEIIERVQPVDMNIVFQRLAVTPGEQFDLVIGTNIFIYYGPFEQSLARANIASLLRPGGFLLSNQQLDDAVPSGLEQVIVVDIPMTDSPVIADHIYCYRRKP
jgi:hypothetical protein